MLKIINKHNIDIIIISETNVTDRYYPKYKLYHTKHTDDAHGENAIIM